MPYVLKFLLLVRIWVLCGGSGMWNGQGYMVILGLEPSAVILAILGPWAGLRQARNSGTTRRGMHLALAG